MKSIRAELRRPVSLCLLGVVLASSVSLAFFQFVADLTELTKLSECVVLGDVREVKSQGTQRSARIQVEEVFKGSSKKEVVVVWTVPMEDEFMSAAVGERLVLFLQRSSTGPADAYEVCARGLARMDVISTETGVMVRVPPSVQIPPNMRRGKKASAIEESALVKLDDLRAWIKSV